MPIEQFIKSIQDTHSKEIQELVELQEILSQLQGKGKRIANIYVTSNL